MQGTLAKRGHSLLLLVAPIEAYCILFYRGVKIVKAVPSEGQGGAASPLTPIP